MSSISPRQPEKGGNPDRPKPTPQHRRRQNQPLNRIGNNAELRDPHRRLQYLLYIQVPIQGKTARKRNDSPYDQISG
jgi:hypothetical protein